MLGTPFQFGKPIQFGSDTAATVLPSWKRVPYLESRRIEAFRPSEHEFGHVATKPCANLYSMSGHRLGAPANDTLAHGWLTYAPVTIVPGASNNGSGTGRNMSITLRPRDKNEQPGLENVLAAAHTSARVRELSASTSQVG